MALYVDLRGTNSRGELLDIERIIIRRTERLRNWASPEDEICTYEVSMKGKESFEIAHRYGDGGWELARHAIDEAQRIGLIESISPQGGEVRRRSKNHSQNPKEVPDGAIAAVAGVLLKEGWTCEYHEPDPDCERCTELHSALAAKMLSAAAPILRGHLASDISETKDLDYKDPHEGEVEFASGYNSGIRHALRTIRLGRPSKRHMARSGLSKRIARTADQDS